MFHASRVIVALVTALAVACSSPEEKRAREATTARAAVAAESARAVVASSLPATSVWDEPHLVQRLVQSGLAPQAVTDAKPESYWQVPVLVYRVGNATLHAYLYRDSTSRRKIVGTLDTLTLAPPGTPSPYVIPRLLIVQNNLAAVLVGGSARQQERVSLAIGAGLSISRAR